MDKIDKEGLIERFTTLINDGLIIDIQMGLRPCIEIGDMITEQIVITHRVKRCGDNG